MGKNLPTSTGEYIPGYRRSVFITQISSERWGGKTFNVEGALLHRFVPCARAGEADHGR